MFTRLCDHIINYQGHVNGDGTIFARDCESLSLLSLLKSARWSNNSGVHRDPTIDPALYGLFMIVLSYVDAQNANIHKDLLG